MKRALMVLLIVALVLSGSTAPAWAEYDTGRQAVTKLFRGIANAATGWMEIPKQMLLVGDTQGVGPALTWGFLKGIGYAVARSVVGGYEIATFPIPVPEDYRPIMQPEYVLSDLPEEPQPVR